MKDVRNFLWWPYLRLAYSAIWTQRYVNGAGLKRFERPLDAAFTIWNAGSLAPGLAFWLCGQPWPGRRHFYLRSGFTLRSELSVYSFYNPEVFTLYH